MKLKKAAAILLAVLICVTCCVTASAAEWKEEDFTLTVPEEFVYTLSPELSSDDPAWIFAGVSDASSKLTEYSDMGVIADFRTEDGTSIMLRQKSSDTSKSIYNLNALNDEDIAEFMSSVLQSNSEDVTILTEKVMINGFPFCKFDIEGHADGTDAYNIFYLTVLNGRSLVIDLYTGENAITEQQKELLLSMVNSINITQILEKPAEQPVNVTVMIALLVLMLAVVIIPLIYVPLQNKRDKKQKAKMADRMSEYRTKYGENPAMGEAKFVNETDCTKEAIRTFSIYHSYIKGIVSLAVGAIMCIAAVSMSFLFDMTWWVKLAAVGVAIYFAYKIIAMPNTIEKVQRKVFGRGTSDTARLTFFEDGFRVTGVQAASIYPYFQISDIRSHGHYLYLYYGPDNAYIVDKYGFTLGEFDDFAEFIKRKTAKQEGK